MSNYLQFVEGAKPLAKLVEYLDEMMKSQVVIFDGQKHVKKNMGFLVLATHLEILK